MSKAASKRAFDPGLALQTSSFEFGVQAPLPPLLRSGIRSRIISTAGTPGQNSALSGASVPTSSAASNAAFGGARATCSRAKSQLTHLLGAAAGTIRDVLLGLARLAVLVARALLSRLVWHTSACFTLRVAYLQARARARAAGSTPHGGHHAHAAAADARLHEHLLGCDT